MTNVTQLESFAQSQNQTNNPTMDDSITFQADHVDVNESSLCEEEESYSKNGECALEIEDQSDERRGYHSRTGIAFVNCFLSDEGVFWIRPLVDGEASEHYNGLSRLIGEFIHRTGLKSFKTMNIEPQSGRRCFVRLEKNNMPDEWRRGLIEKTSKGDNYGPLYGIRLMDRSTRILARLDQMYPHCRMKDMANLGYLAIRCCLIDQPSYRFSQDVRDLFFKRYDNKQNSVEFTLIKQVQIGNLKCWLTELRQENYSISNYLINFNISRGNNLRSNRSLNQAPARSSFQMQKSKSEDNLKPKVKTDETINVQVITSTLNVQSESNFESIVEDSREDELLNQADQSNHAQSSIPNRAYRTKTESDERKKEKKKKKNMNRRTREAELRRENTMSSMTLKRVPERTQQSELKSYEYTRPKNLDNARKNEVDYANNPVKQNYNAKRFEGERATSSSGPEMSIGTQRHNNQNNRSSLSANPLASLVHKEVKKTLDNPFPRYQQPSTRMPSSEYQYNSNNNNTNFRRNYNRAKQYVDSCKNEANVGDNSRRNEDDDYDEDGYGGQGPSLSRDHTQGAVSSQLTGQSSEGQQGDATSQNQTETQSHDERVISNTLQLENTASFLVLFTEDENDQNSSMYNDVFIEDDHTRSEFIDHQGLSRSLSDSDIAYYRAGRSSSSSCCSSSTSCSSSDEDDPDSSPPRPPSNNVMSEYSRKILTDIANQTTSIEGFRPLM